MVGCLSPLTPSLSLSCTCMLFNLGGGKELAGRQELSQPHTYTCRHFNEKVGDIMVVSARSWLANEGGKHFVLMMWLGANIWLFVKTFLVYSSGQQYHYLYKILGLGLCISRASASVLNLNCSLVLLPMCRTLLTFVRGTHTVSSRKTRRLLDKSKTFHVTCGVAICIFSVVHVSAHLVNVVNFSRSYSEDFPALNFARYKGEDPKLIILTTAPGITGVLLVIILFLMFTSSSYCVRIYNYEIFWYTHNLFIIFYIILMVHMVGGALKYQTNIEAHPPGCIRANHSQAEQQGEELEKHEEEKMRCKAEAHFQPHCPQNRYRRQNRSGLPLYKSIVVYQKTEDNTGYKHNHDKENSRQC
ncbi:NADPH oxidase 4-like isoform X4 [Festucalex cinctus]